MSKSLVVIISQVSTPNRIPENPILQGIFGNVLCITTSTIELKISKNAIKIIKLFIPTDLSTLERGVQCNHITY